VEVGSDNSTCAEGRAITEGERLEQAEQGTGTTGE
jgi:hypothetical protein